MICYPSCQISTSCISLCWRYPLQISADRNSK